MSETIEYHQSVKTRPIVQFLIEQRDQCASEKDMAEHFMVGTGVIRHALLRLQKVNRVEEIMRSVWHLI